jgi:hypothetical protein
MFLHTVSIVGGEKGLISVVKLKNFRHCIFDDTCFSYGHCKVSHDEVILRIVVWLMIKTSLNISVSFIINHVTTVNRLCQRLQNSVSRPIACSTETRHRRNVCSSHAELNHLFPFHKGAFSL